jgi:hypothetical protein
MAPLTIANQHIGPLPLKLTFNAPSDGPATLMIAGSVWSATANQHIGIGVVLDGVAIGSASIFSNATTTHRAVVPAYIPVTLKFGAHVLVLEAMNPATIADLNDFFDAILFY